MCVCCFRGGLGHLQAPSALAEHSNRKKKKSSIAQTERVVNVVLVSLRARTPPSTRLSFSPPLPCLEGDGICREEASLLLLLPALAWTPPTCYDMKVSGRGRAVLGTGYGGDRIVFEATTTSFRAPGSAAESPCRTFT